VLGHQLRVKFCPICGQRIERVVAFGFGEFRADAVGSRSQLLNESNRLAGRAQLVLDLRHHIRLVHDERFSVSLECRKRSVPRRIHSCAEQHTAKSLVGLPDRTPTNLRRTVGMLDRRPLTGVRGTRRAGKAGR
jgi:hypothetical protein